ncbi:hypothetical protein ACWCP6_23745 [Streptomyces sp. NPDC002004]
MIKNSVRTLCALSLAIAPVLLASPAHAASNCTVNGVPATGPAVNGTAGHDVIVCSGLDAGDTVSAGDGADVVLLTGGISGTVDAGAGNDVVSLARTATLNADGVINGGPGSDTVDLRGTVQGRVNGNEADDYLVANTVAAGGSVSGGDGSDVISAGSNAGSVGGGSDFDICHVGTGNAPTDCEITF